MRHTRPSCVAFLVLLYNWWSEKLIVHAAEVNVTVDDTDPSILYQPAAAWHSSAVPCSFCLKPDPQIAHQQTFHDGTHIIPTIDNDDLPTSTSATSPRPSVSAQTGDEDGHAGNGKGSGGSSGSSGSNSGTGGPSQHTRRQTNGTEFNPFATSKFDGDDSQFQDTPVFVQFNFTGSAIYLYTILPEGQPSAPNDMPTNVNLTFTLDGQALDRTFRHSGSPTGSGFAPNVNVFAADELTNSPHTLRVDVGPNSVFLFDYLIYTTLQNDVVVGQTTSSASFAHPRIAPTTVASQATTGSGSTESEGQKRHDVATFAGAVGGSVGVLAIFAVCLAGSILYRRWRSARRQRRARERDQESLHTDASEDSPRMYGPAPFVPRYFPGTIPTSPPPYIPSTPSTSSLDGSSPTVPYTPLMSSHSSGQPVSLSYADMPPARSLPMRDVMLTDDLPTVPPPSFGEAIASSLTIPLVLPPPPPPGIPSPTLSTAEQANSPGRTPTPPDQMELTTTHPSLSSTQSEPPSTSENGGDSPSPSPLSPRGSLTEPLVGPDGGAR